MHLEWILNPMALYTLLALGLLATLVLFGSVKVEIALAGKKAEQVENAAAASAARSAAEIEALREIVSNLSALPVHRPAGPANGIDLNRRSQVLRMQRRGEPIATIAAALEIPRNEVELLLKVHQITTNQATKAS